MDMVEWGRVRYFTANENWGNVSRISPLLIYQLDAYRDFIQTPIHISCGTQGIHKIDGEHYKGLAVDVLFPEKNLADLPDLFLNALRFDFRGIGVYPFWTIGPHFQSPRKGGLHLDVRDAKYRALWVQEDRGLPYSKLDFKTLNQLCL